MEQSFSDYEEKCREDAVVADFRKRSVFEAVFSTLYTITSRPTLPDGWHGEIRGVSQAGLVVGLHLPVCRILELLMEHIDSAINESAALGRKTPFGVGFMKAGRWAGQIESISLLSW